MGQGGGGDKERCGVHGEEEGVGDLMLELKPPTQIQFRGGGGGVRRRGRFWGRGGWGGGWAASADLGCDGGEGGLFVRKVSAAWIWPRGAVRI